METENTEITSENDNGVIASVTHVPESASDDHGRDSASEKAARAMSTKKEDEEEELLKCSPTDKKKKKKSRKKKKSVESGSNASSVAPDEKANPNDSSLSSIGKLTSDKESGNNEETLEKKSPSKKKKKKKRKKTESMSSASPEPPCSGDDDEGLTGCAELQSDDKHVSEAEMSTGDVADVTPRTEIKKGRDKENSDISNKPHDTDEVLSTEKEGSDVMDSVKETYKESKNGSNPSLVENTETTETRKGDLCMSGKDENESVDVASFDRNRDTPAPVAFSTQPKVEGVESDAEDNSSSTLGCEG